VGWSKERNVHLDAERASITAKVQPIRGDPNPKTSSEARPGSAKSWSGPRRILDDGQRARTKTRHNSQASRVCTSGTSASWTILALFAPIQRFQLRRIFSKTESI